MSDDDNVIRGPFSQTPELGEDFEDTTTKNDSPYSAFLTDDRRESESSFYDDFETYLSFALGAINEDYTRMIERFGASFAMQPSPMTGIYLPMSISMPYEQWTDIVVDYRDKIRSAKPREYARVQRRFEFANNHPHLDNPFSPQEKEIEIFGNHLVSGLLSFAKLAKTMKRHLPELDVRPAARLTDDNIIILNALVRRKDGDKNKDIRGVLADYLNRASKGRPHLRPV
jgi:hypothetical protein